MMIFFLLCGLLDWDIGVCQEGCPGSRRHKRLFSKLSFVPKHRMMFEALTTILGLIYSITALWLVQCPAL